MVLVESHFDKTLKIPGNTLALLLCVENQDSIQVSENEKLNSTWVNFELSQTKSSKRDDINIPGRSVSIRECLG